MVDLMGARGDVYNRRRVFPLIQIKRIEKSDAAVIRQLADAFASEWPKWATRVGRAAVEASFVSGEAGLLPAVFAALRGEEAIGTVALRRWFDEAPMAQSPWVRGLWVARAHRGRRVDRALMKAAEAEAMRLGFRQVHAATTSIERLGERWGWHAFHRLEHHGEPMVWMVKRLA